MALLKAIPESLRAELVSQREVGSVSIIFKILRVYQPGGLGERTAMLRLASLQHWDCLSLDVKSAFLLAPRAQGETVIVKPPRILEEAHLAQPGEHWLVTSAMYGLVTSPKDWSSFRDAELQKMVGTYESQGQGEESHMGRFAFRPMEDPNLWALQECSRELEGEDRKWGKVLGHMIVYVDDVLMVGPKVITDAASATVREPEYAEVGVRFLGIEIQRLRDGSYFLHQESYAREVIDRRPETGSARFIKVPEDNEEEEAPCQRSEKLKR